MMTEYQQTLFEHYWLFINGNLLLAGALFCIGIVGFFVKQNAISLFMCVEMMINAANLLFVSFALLHGSIAGAVIVLFVITVAAAEAGVGLAIFIAMSRTEEGIDVNRTIRLRESEEAPAPASQSIEIEAA